MHLRLDNIASFTFYAHKWPNNHMDNFAKFNRFRGIIKKNEKW